MSQYPRRKHHQPGGIGISSLMWSWTKKLGWAHEWADIEDLEFQRSFTPWELLLSFAPQYCGFTDAPKLCTPGSQASITQHTLCDSRKTKPGRLSFPCARLHSSRTGQGLCAWASGAGGNISRPLKLLRPSCRTDALGTSARARARGSHLVMVLEIRQKVRHEQS